MKLENLSKELSRAFDKTVKELTSKKSLPYFSRLMLMIRQRTRAGYGTKKWGAKRYKLAPLSDDYIDQREYRGFNSAVTNAVGSNLTRTGKMLNAMRAFFIKQGRFEIGFRDTRGETPNNSEIAGYHEDGKRPFINPDDRAVSKFKKDLTKGAKEILLKEIRKLK